jgi:hypothetical protein
MASVSGVARQYRESCRSIAIQVKPGRAHKDVLFRTAMRRGRPLHSRTGC